MEFEHTASNGKARQRVRGTEPSLRQAAAMESCWD